MDKFALALITVGFIGVVFCLLWGLVALIAAARRAYKKRIWESALYIAANHPELLKEARQYGYQPSTSTEVMVPRRRSVANVTSIGREELETYVYRLEERISEISEKWTTAVQSEEFWREQYNRVNHRRDIYWKRIKRVIAAEDDGQREMWAALHPALARAAT